MSHVLVYFLCGVTERQRLGFSSITVLWCICAKISPLKCLHSSSLRQQRYYIYIAFCLTSATRKLLPRVVVRIKSAIMARYIS